MSIMIMTSKGREQVKVRLRVRISPFLLIFNHPKVTPNARETKVNNFRENGDLVLKLDFSSPLIAKRKTLIVI